MPTSCAMSIHSLTFTDGARAGVARDCDLAVSRKWKCSRRKFHPSPGVKFPTSTEIHPLDFYTCHTHYQTDSAFSFSAVRSIAFFYSSTRAFSCKDRKACRSDCQPDHPDPFHFYSSFPICGSLIVHIDPIFLYRTTTKLVSLTQGECIHRQVRLGWAISVHADLW